MIIADLVDFAQHMEGDNEMSICTKEELENINHCLSEYLRTGELTMDHIRDTTDAMNIVNQYWLRTVSRGY